MLNPTFQNMAPGALVDGGYEFLFFNFTQKVGDIQKSGNLRP